MQKLTIERVPLDKLHEDPANARKHDAKNLDAIRASLADFNQVEPLVVQRASGRIIGGNGRYAAMKALAWTECDVVYLDVDETTAARLAIALNRTAELATWDDAVLRRLVEGFAQQGLTVPGWSPEDLQNLLQGIALPIGAGKTVEEYAEDRASTLLRQIVLVMNVKQYDDVLARFDAIMEADGLDTNTEVVLHLLDHYERTRGPPR